MSQSHPGAKPSRVSQGGSRKEQTIDDLFDGAYQVEKPLGTGTLSTVLAVTDNPASPGRFAAKTIRAEIARDEGFRARFTRDVARWQKLGNENSRIAKVDKFGLKEDSAFVVIERLDGMFSLARFIKDNPRLSPPQVCALLHEIAEALHAAHSAPDPLIHGDLKPSNIYVRRHREGFEVKLVDFGIAAPMTGRRFGDHRIRPLFGTPGYMSPEQVQGQPLDARSDEFVLAVLFYELLRGKSAFCRPEDVSDEDALRRVLDADVKRFALEPRLESAMLRALSRLPTARFPTVRQFAGRLRGDLPQSEAGSQPPQLVPAAQPQRPGSRLPLLLLLAIAASLAWFLGSRAFKATPPPPTQATQDINAQPKPNDPTKPQAPVRQDPPPPPHPPQSELKTMPQDQSPTQHQDKPKVAQPGEQQEQPNGGPQIKPPTVRLTVYLPSLPASHQRALLQCTQYLQRSGRSSYSVRLVRFGSRMVPNSATNSAVTLSAEFRSCLNQFRLPDWPDKINIEVR